MKGRAAAVAAISAVVLAAMPSLAATPQQATPDGVLAVRAAHTASAQLRLRAGARLDGDPYTWKLPNSVLKASGTYGGVLLYKGRHLLFALLKDRDLPAPLVFGAPRITLAPGTYTVMVAGDGPVSVHLPLLGSRASYALRARDGARLHRVSVETSETLPTSGVTGDAGYASVPLRLPQGNALVLAYAIRSNSSQLDESDLCLMPRDAPCTPPDEVYGVSGPTLTPGAVGEGWEQLALFAYPGDIRAGDYYEVGDHADLAVSGHAVLIGYVFG